jgi:hypothetical protein
MPPRLLELIVQAVRQRLFLRLQALNEPEQGPWIIRMPPQILAENSLGLAVLARPQQRRAMRLANQ